MRTCLHELRSATRAHRNGLSGMAASQFVTAHPLLDHCESTTALPLLSRRLRRLPAWSCTSLFSDHHLTASLSHHTHTLHARSPACTQQRHFGRHPPPKSRIMISQGFLLSALAAVATAQPGGGGVTLPRPTRNPAITRPVGPGGGGWACAAPCAAGTVSSTCLEQCDSD